MIIVVDAAPLIFLANINKLNLLRELFNAEIKVPSAVSDEILDKGAPPHEERLLRAFLIDCKIVSLRRVEKFAGALSYADNSIMTLATREKADYLLSDDRLLRKTAALEGFQVLGTLGILLRATKASILSPTMAIELLEELVYEHSFRISTIVFESARKAFLGIEGLTGE